MEQFAQGRPEDEKLRSWLRGIEQDAIRELDENGVLLSLTERSARLVQDPDPQVRQREKTDLAKSVGRQLVSAIMPVPSKNGMSFLTTLHYDPRFVNSVTLFVRESMERMIAALADEPQKKPEGYLVQIISGEGDSSALAANLQQLERMYPEFSVELMRDGRLLYPPERKNERPKPLVAQAYGPLRDLAERWRCGCGITNAGSIRRCACGAWRCGCGRIHAAFVPTCDCGFPKPTR